MSRAIVDVILERVRQTQDEGFNEAYDDAHDGGELAAAGAAYAINAADQLHPLSQGDGGDGIPVAWPWVEDWWRPTNPRRDLVKAAALLIAEIDKLDRAEAKKGSAP